MSHWAATDGDELVTQHCEKIHRFSVAVSLNAVCLQKGNQ